MRHLLHATRREVEFHNQSENAVLEYEVNWAGELQSAISTSTWTSDTLTITGQTNGNYSASCKVTGSVGKHTLVNQVVTTGGETDERIFVVTVQRNKRNTQNPREYVF